MSTFNDESPNVWVFEFGLHDEAPKKVPYAKAESLIRLIINWAEENDYLVGGGFRLSTEMEDLPVGPDYPAELLYPMRPE